MEIPKPNFEIHGISYLRQMTSSVVKDLKQPILLMAGSTPAAWLIPYEAEQPAALNRAADQAEGVKGE